MENLTRLVLVKLESDSALDLLIWVTRSPFLALSCFNWLCDSLNRLHCFNKLFKMKKHSQNSYKSSNFYLLFSFCCLLGLGWDWSFRHGWVERFCGCDSTLCCILLALTRILCFKSRGDGNKVLEVSTVSL